MKIIQSILLTLLIMALVSLTAFINIRHSNTLCSAIDVRIKAPKESQLIDSIQVLNQLNKEYSAIVGHPLSDINIQGIEKLLQDLPWPQATNVSVQYNGTLAINIEQSKPLFRVLNRSGKGYYVNKNGHLYPLNDRNCARVPLLTGNINSPYSKSLNLTHDSISKRYSLLKDAFDLFCYIQNDKILRVLIDQVYINEQNEFEIIPILGTHTILIGNLNNLNTKFNKLKIFYTQALPVHGWDKYNKINLKYNNQVVCTKR